MRGLLCFLLHGSATTSKALECSAESGVGGRLAVCSYSFSHFVMLRPFEANYKAKVQTSWGLIESVR